MKRYSSLLIILLVAFAVFRCSKSTPPYASNAPGSAPGAAGPSGPPIPYNPHEDEVVGWNSMMLRAIRMEQLPPTKAARALGMLHAAIFNAVNLTNPKYEPYRVSSLPAPAFGALPQAAADRAAYRVMNDLFPSQQADIQHYFDWRMAPLTSGPAKSQGTQLGQAVGEAVLAQRKNDMADPNFYVDLRQPGMGSPMGNPMGNPMGGPMMTGYPGGGPMVVPIDPSQGGGVQPPGMFPGGTFPTGGGMGRTPFPNGGMGGGGGLPQDPRTINPGSGPSGIPEERPVVRDERDGNGNFFGRFGRPRQRQAGMGNMGNLGNMGGRVPPMANTPLGGAVGGTAGFPTISERVGLWAPTPPDFKAFLDPGFRALPPFFMQNPQQFRTAVSGPPTDMKVFTPEVLQVYQLGGRDSRLRSKDQTDAVEFWAGGKGTVGTPGYVNLVARELVGQRPQGLLENARLFALMNGAMTDATVTAWDLKQEAYFWRPVTAIQYYAQGAKLGVDLDSNWQPLLATPNHPEYVSSHSAVVGAGFKVLQDYFGGDVPFSFISDNGSRRDFKGGFSQAAAEASQSQVWAGIHFNKSVNDGLTAGAQIGDFAYQRFLRPFPARTR
jgi:hypothetical protein